MEDLKAAIKWEEPSAPRSFGKCSIFVYQIEIIKNSSLKATPLEL